ncbi:hypothetical protein EJD97_013178 [Solanum chilense]|uniref:Uncharacterized protein n=1 Tax=Solanum chilense TaxID=4083 RepID=A0A6N2BBL0_SOLCI|nr:hypothetical protein EJD97_013178 [Solanum chilense]
MDKGKNIQMELTGEELQRKIEQITQKIQEAKKEGLKVDMVTAIYKAATEMPDKDIASQMKRKKDVEMESKDLQEKLDTVEMKEFASIRERMAALRKKNKAFCSNMIDKLQKIRIKYPVYEQEANRGPDNAHPGAIGEDDDEKIIYKPPFLGRLKGGY